jgi:dTDP-4-amino-4,6-dideoxygalactose transaminase
VRQPVIPDDCEQPSHIYYLILPTADARERLIRHLRNHAILAVFHYQPLHLSAMGQRFGGKRGDCPVTEDLCDRLVRLPLYNSMTPQEQEQVVAAVRAFRC